MTKLIQTEEKDFIMGGENVLYLRQGSEQESILAWILWAIILRPPTETSLENEADVNRKKKKDRTMLSSRGHC